MSTVLKRMFLPTVLVGFLMLGYGGHLAMAGLIKDLKCRGLLESTLLVFTSEFGRTPFAQGKNGRDHNPQGFTMWLAGGGTKGGLAYGETDEFGYYAVRDKVHIHDLHATILHLLGLDHERLTYRYAGRDFRLTDVAGNIAAANFSVTIEENKRPPTMMVALQVERTTDQGLDVIKILVQYQIIERL